MVISTVNEAGAAIIIEVGTPILNSENNIYLK